MWYRVIVLTVLVVLLFPKWAVAKPLEVVLFSPNFNEKDFWGEVHQFSRASAKSLGVNFRVNYNTLGSRSHYLESVEDVLKSDQKPDAFLAVSFLQTTQGLLALAEKYDVPVILINNALPKTTSGQIGLPRTRFKRYIGHIAADDYHLSYILSRYLLSQARLLNQQKRIEVVGIAGSRDAPESSRRNLGLARAIKESGNAKLMQVVYADWKGPDAYRMANTLMKRYQQLQVIWSSSDLMALNAQRAIDEADKSVVTGGIDWTRNAIDAIKSGRLTASAGGHFTDGGYAMVMLYDYLYGRDFAAVMDLSIHSASALIHQGNIDKYYDLLVQKNWQAIDFKQYSRVHNPQNKGYDFSFERLLQLSNQNR